MSISYIPASVRFRLWGKAGGRCQFPGCNKPLWIDALTKAEFNSSYIAHIVADKPKGPRGDSVLSKKLKKDFNNLMLMCDTHHRLIDKEMVEYYTVEKLIEFKIQHEERIVRVGGISPDLQTHVVLYGANIGDHTPKLRKDLIYNAIAAKGRYPADDYPIDLSLRNSGTTDDLHDYWQREGDNLRNRFDRKLRDRLQDGEISHLSVFGFAPQPLLALFGHLLSDIPAADLYQLHRSPVNWEWQDTKIKPEYLLDRNTLGSDYVVLAISLSQKIVEEKIIEILGTSIDLWVISISEPNNEFLKTSAQLDEFRVLYKKFHSRIKDEYDGEREIHIFPAAPIPIAIELGRSRMKKVDWPIVVYDYNKKNGGFVRGVEIDL